MMMTNSQMRKSACWTRITGGSRHGQFKKKARVYSPGQALRYIQNQAKEAYLCPECGYVHIGSPKAAES